MLHTCSTRVTRAIYAWETSGWSFVEFCWMFTGSAASKFGIVGTQYPKAILWHCLSCFGNTATHAIQRNRKVPAWASICGKQIFGEMKRMKRRRSSPSTWSKRHSSWREGHQSPNSDGLQSTWDGLHPRGPSDGFLGWSLRPGHPCMTSGFYNTTSIQHRALLSQPLARGPQQPPHSRMQAVCKRLLSGVKRSGVREIRELCTSDGDDRLCDQFPTQANQYGFLWTSPQREAPTVGFAPHVVAGQGEARACKTWKEEGMEGMLEWNQTETESSWLVQNELFLSWNYVRTMFLTQVLICLPYAQGINESVVTASRGAEHVGREQDRFLIL